MTVLITGSRGRVARALTALLHDRGVGVRVASRKPEEVQPPEGVRTTALSLDEPSGFPAALAGVDSVFLYAEASHIGAFLERAEQAGVGHVVLLSSASVMEPDAERDPIARHHLAVETALAASPITSTVLRPGAFAANALQWAWPVKASGAVNLPYPGAHTDPVHEADLAEAACAALTDSRVRGGTYHLTGPESLSFAAQVEVLADITGQPIAAVPVSREAWRAETAEHLPEAFAEALLDWWKALDGTPTEVTDTLERLIGRPPRTFASWARENAAAFTRP
ncbi:NAD(P)H-binding protein [Streptomyces sp. CBMA29]|uniref:NAD(P)H-binding protein n=1 Tax=Streptomyces sp. CBMA29 TaxID=1896314 RepID=UPI001662023C|nr:NAD(P)H-binding protein [Streptomyces sp. CBMA29]MBD0738940.1 NmrA family transcriptional regulator [Streptomyces sp. CBMA29]